MNGGALKLEYDIIRCGNARLKTLTADDGDMAELILRRKLPRDLPVAPAVRPFYLETWDALRAEA